MSGKLRLATKGVQDQWLTGDPMMSYFLMNYKRHSKFAIDYAESQFDGDIEFGKTITCRIPNDNGDLLRNTNLKVRLKDPSPAGNEWVPSVISHMIEYAELLVCLD